MRFGFIFTTILASAFCAVAQLREIRVNVTDPAGASVSNAAVRAVPGRSNAVSCPSDEEAYVCAVPEDVSLVFEIEAKGFKRFRIEYAAPDVTCCEYVFVLQVAGINETVVTVGRTESLLGETPESVAVLSRERIATTAAPTLDDALRQVPGFSIFRRSSSRNANPTTQGVSLRGVGASGASRSIVMVDGVPRNDPFGGWVQWNRISPIAVESVEVLRGGASSLYGNSGLSGAIELVPRRADHEFVFSGEAFGGSQRTLSGSAFAGGQHKGWNADVSGGLFQTRGYIPVDEDERGPVDSFAGVRSSNVSPRVGRKFGGIASIFFRPTYFDEARTNGTPAQINRTHSWRFVFGGDLGRSLTVTAGLKGATLNWRVYGGTQVYDQTFSAVSANRETESLTRLQRSPSQNFGFSTQVSAEIRNHSIVAGIEGREVRGSSDEVGFSNNTATSLFGAGGRERTIGAFAKDVIAIGNGVVLSAAIRYDRWRNFRALSATRNLSTGVIASTAFVDREETAFSPQVSLLVHATNMVSFHASASRSFRAPTLNELYRGFRVGNVLTTANQNLLAERANNFEAGARFSVRAASLRTTVFLTEIDRAIANVTISSTPSLITRQRQNAGKTRTAGIEIDAETTIKKLELNAGYLFVDSRVNEFPTNPILIDKFIPQVPRHQFTLQTRYPIRDWTFAVQGRASSAQFDDDLNLFRLEPYFHLDVFLSRKIGEKARLFVAVENLFNKRYSVGRTPVRTVSSPLNMRAGIRWN